MTKPFIVGIGGTTRQDSYGERMVRAVLAECEAMGAETQMFPGNELAHFPHYSTERSERTETEETYIEAVRRCDGLVIGSPGYHGSVSGLVKNAIDVLQDLYEDERPYLDGRAVGLVVVAAGWQACGVTLQALRAIVHALRGWPTPMGITVNTVEQQIFDAEGNIIDPRIIEACRAQAEQVMYFASHKVPRGGDTLTEG